MKYKIQRAKGREESTIYSYSAPGHYDCVPTRLFDLEGGGDNDIEGAKIIMGITYFAPGGYTDFTNNPMESIYYILSGQMTKRATASTVSAALTRVSSTAVRKSAKCWSFCSRRRAENSQSAFEISKGGVAPATAPFLFSTDIVPFQRCPSSSATDRGV